MKTERQVIKVLLVDDHPVIREGVRACLKRHEHFKFVGEAASGLEGVQMVKKLLPDVVVMDVIMPGMNGFDATKSMQTDCPLVKVVLHTCQDSVDFVREAVQAGARGLVQKSSSPAELMSAIEAVHRGELFFKPEAAEDFFLRYVRSGGRPEKPLFAQLSAREREALRLLAEGLACEEIADRLNIRAGTVKKHCQRIMKKHGLHKCTELMRFALHHYTINTTSGLG